MSQIEVPPEILGMPVSDRIELVAKIWDSISRDGLPPLSDEHRKVLDERLAAHRANPESGITLAELRNELLGDS